MTPSQHGSNGHHTFGPGLSFPSPEGVNRRDPLDGYVGPITGRATDCIANPPRQNVIDTLKSHLEDLTIISSNLRAIEEALGIALPVGTESEGVPIGTVTNLLLVIGPLTSKIVEQTNRINTTLGFPCYQ